MKCIFVTTWRFSCLHRGLVWGYISPSRCGLAALAFLGLFPCGTQVLGFVGFFYFDSTHSSQPTPHLEREHGLRRSLPDDLIWLCSSPKTRMRLLVWTYFPHTCGTRRTPQLTVIIKGSESGFWQAAVPLRNLSSDKSIFGWGIRCSFVCSTSPPNPWLSSRKFGNL